MPRRKSKGVRKSSSTRPAWAKSIPAATLAAYRRQYQMSGAGQSGGSFWDWLKRAHDWVKQRRVISNTGHALANVFPEHDWIPDLANFAHAYGYGRQSGGAVVGTTVNHKRVLRTR